MRPDIPSDLEELLDGFDAAWQQLVPPRVEDFLPPRSGPDYHKVLVRLVRMDLERRTRARERVRVEDYLCRFPELREGDGVLLDLVLLERELRRRHDPVCNLDEYPARFPELAEQLVTVDHVPVAPANTQGSAAGGDLDLRDYVLLDLVGKGGMGEVYRGRDPALARSLAVKVLRPELRGNAEAERRFQQEARINGLLQHPSIVPVYNLGRMPDGRLYFTMKLVRGRTLAEMLKVGPASSRPGTDSAGRKPAPQELLGIFEKVCQALAYAHSRKVIHRDLKPANVMVGAFGEVQVMDWGLAKVLPRQYEAPAGESTMGVLFTTKSAGSTADEHGPTGVVGTPAYMAPEQARGTGDDVDERADVFGLGGILCAILTGQPPYTGKVREEVVRKAATGDLGEAIARLDASGADSELIQLCKACLTAAKADRPGNAGVVAERVTAYQAAVQQRLHAAEVERAAAQARAEEAAKKVAVERRARRAVLGLAAAVLLLALVVGSGAWMVQRQQQSQAHARQETLGILERQRGPLDAAWEAHDLAKLKEVKAAADRAAAIAVRGNAGATVQARAVTFQSEAEQLLKRATKNNALRAALLDVSLPQETALYKDDGSGQMMALAQKSVDEQYADKFRDWGVDMSRLDEVEIVQRFKEEPDVVVRDVVAALDQWILHLRQKGAVARWQRLLRLAERLDRDEQRRQLRTLLVGDPTRVESVVALLGSPLPWPALYNLGRDSSRRRQRLRSVQEQFRPETAPVLTVVLLAQASADVGDMAGAEEVLRKASTAGPDEVVLLNALGKLLERQGRTKVPEAIERYRAIRVRHRHLGVALARALVEVGRAREGEAVARDLVGQQPENPALYFYLGYALGHQKKWAEAEAASRKAIRFKPDSAEAHENLGVFLLKQNKLAEAEAASRKAIRLKPDSARAHNNLGWVLFYQEKLVEAETSFRKAIELKPDLAAAHSNLGALLATQKKLAEAEKSFRKAIQLKPNFAAAHTNLGNVLRDQKKLAQAEAAHREAILLDPDDAAVHNKLGNVLVDQKKLAEAEAAFRQAIRLKPDYAAAHTNLGHLLVDQKKLPEAEAAFRKAILLKPDDARAYTSLGVVLCDQKKLAEAEVAHRKAIRLNPNLAEAYYNFGLVLHDQKKVVEEEAAYCQAICLKPDYARAHYNLGTLLLKQKKLAEAEAALRKAIEFKADYPEAHTNLGELLRTQKKLKEAEEAFRKAIALKPDVYQAHNNLGGVLFEQKKLVEAETSFRKAIELKPDLAAAHTNLGLVLRDQKKLAEAETAFRKAVSLDPRHAQAHLNLGLALDEKGLLDEAIASFETVIALDPRSTWGHNNLGWGLFRKGKIEESIACYRKAIDLDPANATAHDNLGWALQGMGKLREAQKEYRKSLEIDPKYTGARTNLVNVRRLIALERKLAGWLKGEYKPADNMELLALAVACTTKQFYLPASRLYADAFTADPKLADDLKGGHRYNAVCCAVLAAASKGADKLNDKERLHWHRQSLTWLRADLALRRKQLESGSQTDRVAGQQALRHWQTHNDLASIRDKHALAKLPENERKQWEKLWSDVAKLLQQAEARPLDKTAPQGARSRE